MKFYTQIVEFEIVKFKIVEFKIVKFKIVELKIVKFKIVKFKIVEFKIVSSSRKVSLLKPYTVSSETGDFWLTKGNIWFQLIVEFKWLIIKD